MKRKFSHFQKKEPFLESILCQLRFRKVANFVPNNARVLDLGCGFRGRFLKFVKRKISFGVGVDFSVEKMSDQGIKFMQCNLNHPLPLSDKEFTVVTSLAVVEHLDDYSIHLQESFRVLKKNGLFIITSPSKKSKIILELLASLRLLSKEEINDHKRYFNEKELCELLKNTGFIEVRPVKLQFGLNILIVAIK